MTKTILIWTLTLILLVSSVSAFFGTPSNNIIVSNNLYNGSFDISDITTESLVVSNNNNTITIYNPISYYKEGTTTGELHFKAPYVPTNASITYYVEHKSNGTYYTYANYILNNEYVNGAINYSTISVIENSLSDNAFSNSFDKVGVITKAGVMGIGAGNSFFAPLQVEDLEFRILKVVISGTNTSLDWGNGWEFEAITTPFTSPTHSQGALITQWHSNNDGAGSQLDAGKFGNKFDTYFFWGNGAKGSIASTLDSWNETSDRIGSYSDGNAIDGHFGFGGYLWETGLYLPLDNSVEYGNQLQFDTYRNRLAQRSYVNGVWGDYEDIVTENFGFFEPNNTNFTGNHTQNGNMNITGNLSVGGGYTGNCINVSVTNGIITGCND